MRRRAAALIVRRLCRLPGVLPSSRRALRAASIRSRSASSWFTIALMFAMGRDCNMVCARDQYSSRSRHARSLQPAGDVNKKRFEAFWAFEEKILNRKFRSAMEGLKSSPNHCVYVPCPPSFIRLCSSGSSCRPVFPKRQESGPPRVEPRRSGSVGIPPPAQQSDHPKIHNRHVPSGRIPYT